MKSLKKTLVLLVVLSMILSAVSPVFAFNDVIAEEYAEQANKMGAFGVFAGDNEGNFKAEENITRAEMAVIIGKLMGLTANEANANQYYASNFSDVAAGDWYTGWVNLVAGRGIISGFPDGTFRPNEKVTQAQAVTMIVKALGWGVVVDQTGTWPANYITKASELRLFKDAVESNGELVTRGNVAIYCYNALTAKTWDVTSSEDGKLTSSKTSDTILEKYFSDFVNEAGEMKLVENAKVTKSGALTSEIGVNQIELDVENAEFTKTTTLTTLSLVLDLKTNPKNKEEKTYATSDSDVIVAYVPAEVANIANLAGKTVDVIFGKNNEVAYIAVTDDTVDAAYVTAFDLADEEIEIDGVAYDFAKNVTVKVFNQPILAGSDNNTAAALTAIDGLLRTDLGISNAAKNMTKNVIAEITLTDDEISVINFKFSAAYSEDVAGESYKVEVAEYVVEKISSKDVLTTTAGKVDIEEIEEKADPRVIRNDEIATLYDIEAGDVVTEVKVNGKVVTVIAVANTVEGELADYAAKTNAFEIDGTDYVSAATVVYNENGEVDDFENATAPATVYGLFEEEVVTAYLNMAGEVVAVVGEAEATGTVLGVVTQAGSVEDDNDDVKYIELRILAEDGSEKKYSIYNKKSGKDIDEAEYNEDAQYKANQAIAVGDFDLGAIIRFEADADRVIKSDKIEIIKNDEHTATDDTVYDFKSNSEVAIKTYSSFSEGTINIDKKTIGSDRFTSATIAINPEEEEVISKWEVLTEVRADKDEFVYTGTLTAANDGAITIDGKKYNQGANKNVYVFTKNSRIIYIIANIDEVAYGASDAQYGILLDVNKDKDEDDETIYVATVLVDGVEETYECDAAVRNYEEGSFISFRVTDGEFKADPTVLVNEDVTEVISKLKDDTTYIGYNGSTADVDALAIATITADSLTDDEKKAITAEYNAIFDALNAINEALGDAKETLTATKAASDFADKEAANTAIGKLTTDIAAVKAAKIDTFTTTFDADTLAYLEDVLELVDTTTVANTKTYESIKVDSVEVVDGATYVVFEDESTIDLADGYIVYDLSEGEMADEITDGDYIVWANDEEEEGEYEIVVIL